MFRLVNKIASWLVLKTYKNNQVSMKRSVDDSIEGDTHLLENAAKLRKIDGENQENNNGSKDIPKKCYENLSSRVLDLLDEDDDDDVPAHPEEDSEDSKDISLDEFMETCRTFLPKEADNTNSEQVESDDDVMKTCTTVDDFIQFDDGIKHTYGSLSDIDEHRSIDLNNTSPTKKNLSKDLEKESFITKTDFDYTLTKTAKFDFNSFTNEKKESAVINKEEDNPFLKLFDNSCSELSPETLVPSAALTKLETNFETEESINERDLNIVSAQKSIGSSFSDLPKRIQDSMHIESDKSVDYSDDILSQELNRPSYFDLSPRAKKLKDLKEGNNGLKNSDLSSPNRSIGAKISSVSPKKSKNKENQKDDSENCLPAKRNYKKFCHSPASRRSKQLFENDSLEESGYHSGPPSKKFKMFCSTPISKISDVGNQEEADKSNRKLLKSTENTLDSTYSSRMSTSTLKVWSPSKSPRTSPRKKKKTDAEKFTEMFKDIKDEIDISFLYPEAKKVETTETEFSYLHYACKQRDSIIVKDCLRKNNVNLKDTAGLTPLHYSCIKGYSDLAEILLKYDADVGSCDKYWKSPMHVAVSNKHLHIVKLLCRYNADINAIDLEGSSPLHYASKDGYLDIVKYLIENKAEVSLENVFKQTPLHLAAMFGYEEVVDLLIKNGAKMNVEDCIGYTPLQYAKQRGNTKLMTKLINCGGIMAKRDRTDDEILTTIKNHRYVIHSCYL